MHIILVSNRLATARSVTLTWRHLLLATAAFIGAVIIVSSLVSYFTVRHAAEVPIPFLQQLVRLPNVEDNQRSNELMRSNMDAMAVKLGEMQAKLMRLDTLGDRLAGLAGF